MLFRSKWSHWNLLPVLALTMLTAGCGLSGSDEDQALVEATLANTADIPAGTKIVVAEQNASQSLPWRLSGSGAGTPHQVEFADFSGGPAVIAEVVPAFAAGAVDAAIGDDLGRAVAANNWQDTHPDEYYVKVQGIEFEQGKKLLDEIGISKYYPIDARSTALFQTVADGLLDTGTITTPVDIGRYLDGCYNAIVEAQNEVDSVTLKPID